MSYINIKITDEQVSAEQKAVLISKATQLLVEVLNINSTDAVVVIDEVGSGGLGDGSELVISLRDKTKAAAQEHPVELHGTGGLMAWPEPN